MQNEELNENLLEAKPSAAEAHSEIQEYLAVSQQRRRLFPRAALVGLGAGLLGSLFRMTLTGADAIRNGLIQWARLYPLWGWIFPILFSITGAVASLALVRRFAPETSGSGIPHIEAVLHRLRTMTWSR